MHRSAALSAAIEVFLPSLCINCETSLNGSDRELCASCWSLVVPISGARCTLCGGPSDEMDQSCLGCEASKPPQSATVIWGEHAGMLRRTLVALKHGGRDELARPLGMRLAARVAVAEWAPEITVVAAVPSHPFYRLRRGWTAASLLAETVARSLQLPFSRLLRRRGLERQTGRSRSRRLRLPAKAFKTGGPVQGARVLVVDDVTTTGTTLRRAATTLLNSGAEAVFCAALAFSPDPRRMS